jgi:hypothetical protein
MRRYYRFALLLVLVTTALACGLITAPLNNAKNIQDTAQAIASSVPQIGSAIPSLEAVQSAFPSLEAVGSAIPTIENLFNPTGEPVASWNDIPIMPQATAGADSGSNQYSFKAPVVVKDVQDFYTAQLTDLGWSQSMNLPAGGEMSVMIFSKDNQTLSITATAQGDGVLVLLVLE